MSDLTQEQVGKAWAEVHGLPLVIAEKRREIRELERQLRDAEAVIRQVNREME